MSEIRVDNITNEEGTGSPNIIYDNAASGLTATSIKGAIDEVSEQAVNRQELLAGVSEAADIDEAVSFIGRGAIVESGSNDNGHYVRWENGEQVCWAIVEIDGSTIDNVGVRSFDLPASFSEGAVSASCGPAPGWSNNSMWADLFVQVSPTSWGLRSATSGSGLQDAHVFAWGFWK